MERDYAWTWTGAVVLHDTTTVGVAFEACWALCDPGDPAPEYRSDILWRESTDDGATWAKSQAVVACADDDEYAQLPSIAWPAGGSRYVMAARWFGMNQGYNVPFRIGAGTP